MSGGGGSSSGSSNNKQQQQRGIVGHKHVLRHQGVSWYHPQEQQMLEVCPLKMQPSGWQRSSPSKRSRLRACRQRTRWTKRG